MHHHDEAQRSAAAGPTGSTAARRGRRFFAARAAAALLLPTALAGAACAQSSMTLYGILDASVRYERGAAGSVKSLGSGLSRGSRLAFARSKTWAAACPRWASWKWR